MEATEATTSTDIAKVVETNPVIVLTDEAKATELIAYIDGEIKVFVPDLATDKGRKAVATFAHKITRTKTAIDEAGLKMVKRINASRKSLAEKLDERHALARKPLTDWEEVENKRVEHCNEVMSRLRAASIMPLGMTIAQAEERLANVRGYELPEDVFRDLHETAVDTKAQAIATLESGIAQLHEAEKQKEELQRLRAQQAERDAAAAAPKEEPTVTPAAGDGPAQQAETRTWNDYESDQPLAGPSSQAAPEASAATTDAQPKPTPVYQRGTGQLGTIAGYSQKVVLAYLAEAIRIECGIPASVASTVALAIVARQIPNVTVKF